MAVRTHWDVEHACSHSVDHDLSRRPADKRAAFASKEEWLASKRAEEQEAAVAWAKQFDMPQ